MQKVELSDDEDNDDEEESENDEITMKNKPLDPRAGRVNVDLPQVPFNPQQIADLLKQYKFVPSSTTKTRRQIERLISEFSDLAAGNMPLGVKEVRIPHPKSAETNPKLAAQRLVEFEDELYADTKGRLKRKNNKKIITNNIEHISEDDDVFLEENIIKKPKINQNDSEVVSEIEFCDKAEDKIVENKRKKMKNIVKKSDNSTSIVKKKSLKEKTVLKKESLKKEMKIKSKKCKTKKLGNIKESLKSALMDGIDDFADFKKASMPLIKKKKVKQIDAKPEEIPIAKNSIIRNAIKKITNTVRKL